MDAPRDVSAALALVETVQRDLVADLRAHDLDPGAPSRLAGWTLGHLLTHLARNADSVVRRLEASAAGVMTSQYEGGVDGRAAEIEAGRTRTFAELIDDVETSGAKIAPAALLLEESAWSFETLSVSGEPQQALTVLQRRSREVVIHHTDLGIDFSPAQWPGVIVDELLSETLPKLPERAGRAQLVGWLTDRGAAPSLSSWG